MTQFVSHIPVDVAVTRPVRPHHIEIKDHHHRQSDSNASFLRAARAGNVEKVLEYLKGSIDINTCNANGLNALHLASKEGHVAVVQELVKRGANVNIATKKGNTALHIASLAGQEEVVKILVQNGANVNLQSQNGFTPLYMAAQENHDGVVKFLLANNANQSLATEDGFTPLAVALQQGHDKVVAVLLENDAKGRVRLPALHIAAKKDDCKAAALLLQNDHDPDVTSKSGFTPLHIAAHYGNENIATLLLEKNADVNYSAKHQITPLHVAAKWGKSNMVNLLIDKGAKIDASTRDGLTPLHCAARSGHDQVVDLLLEKGAPITAKTKNGLAPLHMASQGDHVDSARILLYHKAPVDDVTVDYLTALHVAAHCGHVRVAKLLLDRKADPNARALNGFTPLHIACKKNRIKVVELLLKHGASIEATTESGLTPLHVASFMGCMNIVIYLIQHGANADVPTVRGETPLHLAARANQSDIIRILLRNGAHVDASAREHQTPLHIAARLGNVDIVGLLLQHGAAVDATTKDMYTALHIAAKEGQEEVASVLLDHNASLTATTKKGFTPLHLAAKYGNIKVARLLLQKDAPVDAQGKNGVTPLHVAAHYDHVNVALLLLDKGAFPHATAKNGYTPLHIAAKKNQMDIATTLLEYGAKPNAESKAGFTPLHLAAQEGHTDMTALLIEHHADVNAAAKNGLSPLHLCAQEDKVNVAAILVKNGAKIDPPTKAGYTPLHVACHFGQINMIRFLLQHKADVHATTSHGYTPLHQAAQQGHTLIINLLLEHKASPNTTTNQGQTALSIAQRLGYISVVETLKIVTETIVTTTTTTITEEKYKVVAPETMQETFMSDSEDEGGDDIEDTSLYGKPAHATHVYLPYIEGQKLMTEDTMLGDQSLHYMTTDELKALADDNTLGIDVTRDERGTDSTLIAPLTAEEDHLTPQHVVHQETTLSSTMATDNVDLGRAPVHAGKLKWKTFLVSFMVDARGGAMRGCRHSGVRVIIPPRKAPMPMRITCRYLRKEKLAYPPPLMEGEACASRILEVGPSGAKFLGPVIIEVPHFASLRGREREITILRSDNGESWREHTLEASDDAVHDVFNESFEGEELTAIEDLSTNRITRILTTDFPQYFAIITRIRQEVHAIGPEGGMVSSTVVPQVQAIFPEGALTKKIKVGLQAQPITPELVTKLLGNRVAVSPIVTVEPRRRKFHKPITLTIPVPQAATKGMINQYSGDAPTLRLLCSITGSTKTGGTIKAQWEDVTGSTPLTFVNDCVSFTTTVSARFWLIDCRQVNEATKFATELYREAIHVPFMAKFVVFAKRRDPLEAQLRVFCMTDDKEDKTLESQEHFTEVAKSRDVEVLEGKLQYLEFAGNLVPVTKSGEQLSLTFQAFRENRLPFTIRVKDPHQEPMGRVAFMREPRVGRGEPPQSPICNLNIVLPEADPTPVSELVTLEKKYGFVTETSLAKPELIHRADLRLSDIAKELRDDWVSLALQLDVPESDINTIKSENPNDTSQQALVMLRHWLQRAGSKATGNFLEKGLRKINREDIVNQCMFNVELVTDDVEKAVAKVHLDQSGFDTFKEELGSSRDASLRRETSLNGTYDEQDIMKDAESAAETSSESSDKEAHFRSEARHHDLGMERRTDSENFTRSSKGYDEGPETLVQTVPTALAESFTQGMVNGQLSDTSFHEEDRSEPTVATLSSEATAEMEISSLEDKSQTETHVEKKELHNIYGGRKYFIGSMSGKVSSRDVPDSKKIKKYAHHEATKCKVMARDYSRTMTPPVFNRRRKVFKRRNSWPLDSPLKLNKRKKYQQRLKVRNILEPFWTNTYEWLMMRFAPEMQKQAPLAILSEFKDLEINARPKVASLNSAEISNKISSSVINYSNVLTFYFTKTSKISFSKEKYLQNLKKCLKSKQFCEIPSLKRTNFDLDSVENEFPSYIRFNYAEQTDYSVIPSFAEDARVSTESDNLSLNDYSENMPENFIYRPLQVVYKPTYVFARPSRPLQSFNSDSSGEVLMSAYGSDTDSDFYSVKHQMVTKCAFKDKENILKVNLRHLNNKTFGQVENLKNPFGAPQISKGKQKSISSLSSMKENLVDKPLFMKSAAKEILPRKAPIKNNVKDVGEAPQDMHDPNTPDSGKKVSSKENQPSTSSKTQPSKSTIVQSSSVTAAGESSSGAGQGNKSYARQLFEQDIQSNFAKGLKKNSESEKEEREKHRSLPRMQGKEAENVGHDKSEEVSESRSQAQHSSVIPAEVLGQSFLKTLADKVQLEDSAAEKAPFPASVIGHAFINALLEQQSKVEETAPSSAKTIPANVIGLTFLKTLVQEASPVKEQPLPASVIGQVFLKNLISSQTEISDPGTPSASTDPLHQQTTAEQTEKDIIPATVVGQAFLKSLINMQSEIKDDEKSVPSTSQQSLLEKSDKDAIPAAVVGQAFLKSLISMQPSTERKGTEKSEPSAYHQTLQEKPDKDTIPASVVGQAFLKSLLTIQPSAEEKDIAKPESSASQQASPEKPKKDAISASVIGQAFLKHLLNIQPSTDDKSLEKSIPAAVIGQSFLKSLTEQQISESMQATKTIPAPVVGQAFLKSLIESQESEVQSESDSSKTIPAAVIGQSFLKTLVENQPTIQHSESSEPVPAPVLAQAFVKTLIESQSASSENKDVSKPIPSAVIGQTFLRTLLGETAAADVSSDEPIIPAPVVGQAFLKTLVECENVAKSETQTSIPSSVVGQAFLKSLLETDYNQNVQTCSESSPSADITTEQGTFHEGNDSTKAIPAAVVGQTFLKSLIQEQAVQKCDRDPLIPASVVGQAFLKTLISNEGQSSTSSIKKDTPIPAPVVGQTFLKTLLEQTKSEECVKEKPIPASVIGQAFLKTLVEQEQISESTGSSSKPIPSSVIGQTFLKALITEKPEAEELRTEQAIPSSVVSQAFLKSLLEQNSTSEQIQESAVGKETCEKEEDKIIPASVVGLAFIKTLSEQCEPVRSAVEESVTQTERTLPAGVVGQAFLKTLVSMSNESSSLVHVPSKKDDSVDGSTFSQESQPFSSQSDFVALSEEQPVIPPPPGFRSGEDTVESHPPASQTNVGSLTSSDQSGIVSELLSYTKMMQSVIESMKNLDNLPSDSATNSQKAHKDSNH